MIITYDLITILLAIEKLDHLEIQLSKDKKDPEVQQRIQDLQSDRKRKIGHFAVDFAIYRDEHNA